jgi:hypothetical protein
VGRRVEVLLRVLRDRVLELPRLVLEPDEDVLLLRDPGGEDVRVAMVMSLGDRHTSLMRYTPRAVPNPTCAAPAAVNLRPPGRPG